MRILTITSILLIFIAVQSKVIAQNDYINKPVFLNAGFDIPKDELLILERKSFAGNAESAFRLSRYYAMANVNKSEELYWTTIAAENGSPFGEYNLGFNLIYSNNTDEINKLRAIFWLKKAQAHGVELATSLLKEIGESIDTKHYKPTQ